MGLERGAEMPAHESEFQTDRRLHIKCAAEC